MKQLNHLYHKTINTIFKFGIGVGVVLLSHACGNTNQNDKDSSDANTVEQTDIRKQALQYYEYIEDSVLFANGYDDCEKQAHSRHNDLNTIDSLKYIYILGDTLKKNKTQKIPARVQKTIDSLEQEYIRKENLEAQVNAKFYEASRIAKQKTRERFGDVLKYLR